MQYEQSTIEAVRVLGVLERLFSNNQIGIKVFDFLLPLNQSTDFTVSRNEEGDFFFRVYSLRSLESI